MNKTSLLLAIFICTPFLVLYGKDDEPDHLSVVGAKQVNVIYQTMNQTPKSTGFLPIFLSPFDGIEGRRLAKDFNGGAKISYR